MSFHSEKLSDRGVVLAVTFPIDPSGKGRNPPLGHLNPSESGRDHPSDPPELDFPALALLLTDSPTAASPAVASSHTTAAVPASVGAAATETGGFANGT